VTIGAASRSRAANFIDKIGALFGIERDTDVRCEHLSPIEAKALRLQVRDVKTASMEDMLEEDHVRIQEIVVSDRYRCPSEDRGQGEVISGVAFTP
jgi:hypothetical protein